MNDGRSRNCQHDRLLGNCSLDCLGSNEMKNPCMPLNPFKDTRTEAQKMQQQLFQECGTLHRTRANLLEIYKSLPPDTPAIRNTLEQAMNAVHYLISVNRAAMKNLPNKKRKALLTKAE